MRNVVKKTVRNERFKSFLLKLLSPRNQARPRLWIKLLVNPFIHKKGKRALIRKNIRLDVFPYNNFVLGNDSTIEDFSTINNGVGDVIIGNRSRIGIGNVLIGPLLIGNDVMLAQNVVLSGMNHGFKDVSVAPAKQPVSKSQISVEDNVWIGANVSITAGVKIGKHSIVGAGSVVTKDVPQYSVVAGNPARVMKRYNFDNNNWEKI